jgi:hypothetical protein
VLSAVSVEVLPEGYAQLAAGLLQAHKGIAAAPAQFASRAGTDLAFLRPLPDVAFREVVVQGNLRMIDLLVRGKAKQRLRIRREAGHFHPCAGYDFFDPLRHGNPPSSAKHLEEVPKTGSLSYRQDLPIRETISGFSEIVSVAGKAFSYLGFTARWAAKPAGCPPAQASLGPNILNEHKNLTALGIHP